VTEYYSAKEAAEILGLKYPTLLSRARKGRITAVKVGWSVLFPKKEIDEYATMGHMERAKR